jgi:hypothetical protein
MNQKPPFECEFPACYSPSAQKDVYHKCNRRYC